MGSDWLQLAGCALAIGCAGVRLTRLADAIGQKTGMSGSWVGLLLLATVTSLPELATGISAVTAAHAPDIAVGDVLGSTVFNLALLVMVDVLTCSTRRGPSSRWCLRCTRSPHSRQR